MQDTQIESEEKIKPKEQRRSTEIDNANITEPKPLSLVSNICSLEPKEEKPQSGKLSVDLARHLFDLSKKVTEKEVTPQTVAAACKCAGELYKIMSLNFKMKNSKL